MWNRIKKYFKKLFGNNVVDANDIVDFPYITYVDNNGKLMV